MDIIQPFLHNENLKFDDEFHLNFGQHVGFNNHEIFDLIHWKDPKQYKSHLYDPSQRAKDESTSNVCIYIRTNFYKQKYIICY